MVQAALQLSLFLKVKDELTLLKAAFKYCSFGQIFDICIQDNSVYTEIKLDVTRQNSSAYFGIILTQDEAANSFEGVQMKQTFIGSIETVKKAVEAQL